MTEQHPITPPPELVEKWRNLPEYASQLRAMSTVTITTEKLQSIATQAANWGANQELEACLEWLNFYAAGAEATDLRAARRPKPPSLAEQALKALLHMDQGQHNERAMIVRRALERLQELEGADG